MDSSITYRHTYHQSWHARSLRCKALRRWPKTTRHDNSFWWSLRLYILWRLWIRVWYWSRKCYADHFAAHSIRFHRYLVRRHAPERIWNGIRYIFIYCCKYLRKYHLEVTQSYHYQVIVRYRVRRIINCSYSSFAYQTQQRVSNLPGILSSLESQHI